jgi:hypothetical protein
MHKCFVLVALLLAIGFQWSNAQNTEFSYDGRVRSGGVPFDGNGLFKFAIVSSDGTICYWSNDGVTLTGDEPTSSVQIQVSSGFFSSIIGDETVSGMAPLDPSIFNTEERVNLRVWFNDGAHGFQKLTPDRPITNPSLLGLQSGRPFRIYVNPSTGNDSHTGLTTHTAKRTIQAAWSILPTLMRQDVTIKLADGRYYECPVLSGKVGGGGRAILEGNIEHPELVRLTGSTAADSTTVSLQYGLVIQNQRDLLIKGVSLDHARCNLLVKNESSAEFDHCLIQNWADGGTAIENSSTIFKNVEFRNPLIYKYSPAMSAPLGAYIEFHNCDVHDMDVGVNLGRNTIFRCWSSVFDTAWYEVAGGAGGIVADQGCNVNFEDAGTRFRNMNTAIYASHNSCVTYAEQRVSYTNVNTHVETVTGSYAIN